MLFPDPNIGKPREKVGYFPSRRHFDRFAATYTDAMAQLPEPDHTTSVTTSFGPVRAYRFGAGAGTPLVLLSGRQASTPMWRNNLPGLMVDRPVWSLDSVGEPGASSQQRPLTGPDDQVQWIVETLQGLGLRQVHLLGVSIGGWLAVQVAVRRPEWLVATTLLDPANTFAPLSWKMIAVSLGSAVPVLPMSIRHRLLGWISGSARSSETTPEGRLISSAMRDFTIAQPVPHRPTLAELEGVRVPVLALIAGGSIVHDARRAAENAQRIPQAHVEVWPRASHAINGEYPDDIARRIAEFAH